MLFTSFLHFSSTSYSNHHQHWLILVYFSVSELHQIIDIKSNDDTVHHDNQIQENIKNIEGDKAFLNQVIRKIYKDNLTPENSPVLKCQPSGVFQVECVLCSMKHKSAKLFEAGDKSKYLSHVKAHLETPAHSKDVAQYHENKEATMAKSEENEVADKIKI